MDGGLIAPVAVFVFQVVHLARLDGQAERRAARVRARIALRAVRRGR